MWKLYVFLCVLNIMVGAEISTSNVGLESFTGDSDNNNSKTNTAGECLQNPATIPVYPGHPLTFTSPNYPSKYPAKVKCSWRFQSLKGTRLSLRCNPVFLSLFASLYATDGTTTARKTCVLCIGKKFNHNFAAHYGEVGLKNGFIFRGKGFSCTIESRVVNYPNSPCKCGLTNLNTRIVNGLESEKHEFPWMAALVFTNKPDDIVCGGALVSDYFVMTAAHCTVNAAQSSNYGVRLGIHKLGSYPSTALYLRVLAIYNHPYYNVQAREDYDVALLRIPQVDFSSSSTITIRPICLSGRAYSFDGYTVAAAGWGTTKYGGKVSKSLRYTKMEVVSNAQCSSIYPGRITNRMMCAWRADTDTCQGDSGGPLWTVSQNGYYKELIGIVSWGKGCAEKSYPRVYTRWSAVARWVYSYIGSSSTCPNVY